MCVCVSECGAAGESPAVALNGSYNSVLFFLCLFSYACAVWRPLHIDDDDDDDVAILPPLFTYFFLSLSLFLIVPHYVSLSLFLFAFQTFHLSPLLLVIVKPWPGSAKGAMRNVFANDVEL